MNDEAVETREGNVDRLLGRELDGRYRILRALARGGMGRIYEAEQLALGRRVALKLLDAPTGDRGSVGSDYAERFLREASVLGKLQHANIVTLFDYGRIVEGDTKAYFMAMELLSGETLQQRLRDRRRLTVGETVPIAIQIASGLRAAHARGVVHRDLKPSNVMLVQQDDGVEAVKLIDFGIVKVQDVVVNSAELTEAGMFLGTPAYVSPEQILGGQIDGRADVYSLGVVLFYCLTGELPFGRGGLPAINAHLNAIPEPISSRVPTGGFPAWLETLVARCLAKRPDDRPQSMDEVLAVLQGQSIDSLPLSMRSMPAAPTGQGERRPPGSTGAIVVPVEVDGDDAPRGRRRSTALALGLAVIATVAAAGGVLSTRSNPVARAGASAPPSQPIATAALPAGLVTPPPPAAPTAPVEPPPAPTASTAAGAPPARVRTAPASVFAAPRKATAPAAAPPPAEPVKRLDIELGR